MREIFKILIETSKEVSLALDAKSGSYRPTIQPSSQPIQNLLQPMITSKDLGHKGNHYSSSSSQGFKCQFNLPPSGLVSSHF